MSAAMPMISLGMQGAGAAMGAVGSYYSASNARRNLQTSANVADINARTAELGAQSALAQGERAQQRTKLQTAQLKSTQRAGLAANGVDLGEGSAAQILTSTDVMGEIDAATVEADAVRNAWGYRTQAMNYRNEAEMNRATASAVSPAMGAVTSLLGSAGGVAESWYKFKQAGASDSGASSKAISPISGPAYQATQAKSSWW